MSIYVSEISSNIASLTWLTWCVFDEEWTTDEVVRCARTRAYFGYVPFSHKTGDMGCLPDEMAFSCDQMLMRCSCWCCALRTASARLSEWPASACGRPLVKRVSSRGGGGGGCQPASNTYQRQHLRRARTAIRNHRMVPISSVSTVWL